MTDMPLVTVVVPCYNHVSYVETAIASVSNQTYANVQLVVIDDGSSDGSPELLQRLAIQHDFTLVLQENRGICRTLNRAIREAAQGDWIGLLASDDLWAPTKIQRQVDAVGRHPDCRFCFSQAVEFTDATDPSRGRVFPRRVACGNVLRKVFMRQHVPAGTMLFHRSLFDELGGFDEQLKEEDWDFVIRSAAVTPFAGVDAPLLYYRSHAGNTMRTRGRVGIFRQKALLLSKNMGLVSPWRWLAAILLHFAHDVVAAPLLRRD